MSVPKLSTRWVLAGCAALFLCLGFAAWAIGGDTLTWKALPTTGVYTAVCHENGSGGTVCYDSCPAGRICAEFSNDAGQVFTYCCIHPSDEGSTQISDCITEVELVRSGPPEEVISPW